MRCRKSPLQPYQRVTEATSTFDGKSRIQLPFGRLIKDVSAHLREVDIADQHRSVYKAQRRAHRSYFPSLYWILDYATVNACKVSKQLHLWTDENHFEFHQERAHDLCSLSSGGEYRREVTILKKTI